MDAEVNRLGLPRGVWQGLIQQDIPLATKVQCTYPDQQTVHFELFNDSTMICRFSLSFLFGCKGILVSHGMMVTPEYRNKGIAKKLQPIRDRIAKDLRVSAMICTVVKTNNHQKKVIKHWNTLDSFKNIRTGNEVDIHIRKVN